MSNYYEVPPQLEEILVKAHRCEELERRVQELEAHALRAEARVRELLEERDSRPQLQPLPEAEELARFLFDMAYKWDLLPADDRAKWVGYMEKLRARYGVQPRVYVEDWIDACRSLSLKEWGRDATDDVFMRKLCEKMGLPHRPQRPEGEKCQTCGREKV